MQHSDVCYFWKDNERRFMGASKEFLDVYGIKDIREILGKTDEEIGWHIDEEPYKLDELSVLQGNYVINSIGKCIIRGESRTISASKVPIYRDGEIIGLLGYFTDVEVDAKLEKGWRTANFTDSVTGMLNFKGIMDASIQFEENYRNKKQDFIGVIIEVPEIDAFQNRNGEEAANVLIRRLAEVIRRQISRFAVIARLSRSRFIFFDKLSDADRAREQLDACADEIKRIHKVKGFDCTLLMHYTLAWRSEATSMDAMFTLLIDRIFIAVRENYAQMAYSPDRIVFVREKFDEMNERVYLCDPETYELLYVNKTALLDFGLPEDYDWRGKTCYSVIFGNESVCSNCPIAQLRRDRFLTWTSHNIRSGKDYLMRETLIPWGGKLAKFSMSCCLTDYSDTLRANQEFVYREMAINDAVNVALREEHPDQGIQKLLEKIGEDFRADRTYIFEDEGYRVTSNTYEWCKDGVEAQINFLQHVPAHYSESFYRNFDKNLPMIIPDVEALKTSDRKLYEILHRQGIRSLIAVLLKNGNREIGYFGVDNPVVGELKAIGLMLETLSQFVTFMLRDRDNVRKMDMAGYRDPLTGVMNRRALRTELEGMDAETEFVVIYGDVNGLKQLNDTQGHEKGDELIKSTAEVMSSAVGEENVYRIGGDEFLLVTKLNENDVAGDHLLKQLRESFEQKNISVALGCVRKSGGNINVDELLQEADRRMYLNKQFMYQNGE